MNGLSLESENLPLSAEKTVSTRCSVPKKDLFREKERAATHSTQTWQATCTHTAQLPRWRGIYRRKEMEEVQLQRRTLSLAWGFSTVLAMTARARLPSALAPLADPRGWAREFKVPVIFITCMRKTAVNSFLHGAEAIVPSCRHGPGKIFRAS